MAAKQYLVGGECASLMKARGIAMSSLMNRRDMSQLFEVKHHKGEIHAKEADKAGLPETR